MDAKMNESSSGILQKLFHERIKETTADAHQALEAAAISKALMSPGLDLPTYKTYLKLMLDVNWDVEENVFPLVTDIISDLAVREKSKSIIIDLEVLGETDIVPSERPFTSNGKIITKPFALGILYVTEGSTLGGRYILKNIQKTLQLNGDGTAYFSGYGEQTGSQWKKFMEQLSGYAVAENCEDEIIAGAVFAFNKIQEHFTKSGNYS